MCRLSGEPKDLRSEDRSSNNCPSWLESCGAKEKKQPTIVWVSQADGVNRIYRGEVGSPVGELGE